jgi:ABC-type Na+ transport system ATPase subunit NatA
MVTPVVTRIALTAGAGAASSPPAVRDVSFTAGYGRVTRFLGPNGAGNPVTEL